MKYLEARFIASVHYSLRALDFERKIQIALWVAQMNIEVRMFKWCTVPHIPHIWDEEESSSYGWIIKSRFALLWCLVRCAKLKKMSFECVCVCVWFEWASRTTHQTSIEYATNQNAHGNIKKNIKKKKEYEKTRKKTCTKKRGGDEILNNSFATQRQRSMCDDAARGNYRQHTIYTIISRSTRCSLWCSVCFRLHTSRDWDWDVFVCVLFFTCQKRVNLIYLMCPTCLMCVNISHDGFSHDSPLRTLYDDRRYKERERESERENNLAAIRQTIHPAQR